MNELNGSIVCIVMHDRHIYVGRIEMKGAGWVRLTSPVNVRYWAGSNEPGHGLGRLLRTGPQPDDRLDPCPPIWLSLPSPQAHVIECVQANWEATCPA